jgi:hypothetical protein
VKRLLSFALILATTFTAAGCSDTSTGPAGSLTGTYTLRAISGQLVPASLYYNSASDHIEILSSQITLYSDGTYADATRVQDTQNGFTQTYDDNTQGNWLLSGSQLTLADRNDPTHVTYAYATSNQISISNYAGYGVTAEYDR